MSKAAAFAEVYRTYRRSDVSRGRSLRAAFGLIAGGIPPARTNAEVLAQSFLLAGALDRKAGR